MLTGYITFVDQSFSGIRLGAMAVISYQLIKQEYLYQRKRPIIHKRMMENYPDIRLNTSGNPVMH